MSITKLSVSLLALAGSGFLATPAPAQVPPPVVFNYKIVNSAQHMGTGGIDYVCADSVGRRLYVPRGGQVLVFDLDSLKSVGTIPDAKGVHGAAIDPKSHHGFSSSNPVLMWDTQTLATLKTIPVEGNPDGIYFEAETERVYVLSHRAPNATVIDAKDGAIVGTIDLGGAPEQAVSDGHGHLFVDIEDNNNVAVVDVKTLKVTAHYDLGGKATTPAGLGLDAKNHILFAFCRNPATAVIMNADDGKIISTLPIGSGTDGGGFNPNTMEAFSSQRDGTLTIIKETSPTTFTVAQTVQTKPGAKTCTLDEQKNNIILIATERPAADAAVAAVAAPATNAPAGGQPGGRRSGRGNNGPALLDLIVVGRR